MLDPTTTESENPIGSEYGIGAPGFNLFMKNIQYLVYLLIQINFIKSSEIFSLNIGVHLLVDNQYIENSSSLEFQNGKIEKDLDHPLIYPEYP
ncbi:unnamed protein product [Adineta steineri]|uniref:Uncharacterized protein n=1 Tax=Adineta steineri TaxID=433720 RepID=A0A813X9R4_9BILA|nr:unnamed protein product [Adineta steineri]CAF3803568.1 unnamed protein product [Adineta steineri]